MTTTWKNPNQRGPGTLIEVEPKLSLIKIDILRLDFQAAECLIEETVRDKMQQIANGQPLEPILVRFDGESYFVQDGFHRVEAARRSGISEIDAEISPGTMQEMEHEFRKFLDALKTDLASRPDGNPGFRAARRCGRACSPLWQMFCEVTSRFRHESL
jgi:uncharacterized ParB-like nuclease family protein